jgi:chemotaxis protein MotB
MKPSAQPIIVVRKKVVHGGGHHGGAWKVAYADFVTAMMAFFMVMWLVNQDPSVKKAVAGYFRDPGVFAQTRSTGILPGGRPGVEPGQTEQRAPSRSTAEETIRTEERTLAKAAEHMKSALEQMPDVADLRDQVEFSLTSEGLRIELVDKPGSSFFATGSASLTPESLALLKTVGVEIGQLHNDVVIEGHTDSRPFTTASLRDNWDLSTERALAARRVIEPLLQTGQLRAVKGLADTQLHLPGDPLDPRNRRVSILVRIDDAASVDRAFHPLELPHK